MPHELANSSARPRAGAFAVLLAVAALAGCSGKVAPPTGPGPTGPPRSFMLGMTPFPAEFTANAFDEALDFAGTHGEFMSNHHDEGVPWAEMLAGTAPPPGVVTEFAIRRNRVFQHGVQNYVSLTFLTIERDSIARGPGGAPWPPAIAANPTFANPAVRAALKRWCAWAATYYAPARLSPGIEINFYASQRPADWPNLVSLYAEVYDTLKTIRPSMKVFPTFQLEHLYGQSQWSLVPAFETHMDAFALSTYPGGALITPAALPASYLSQARTATGTAKPLVISETGYGDSTVTPYPGSREMQRDYLSWLAAQADSLGIEQITWFFPANIWTIYAQTPPAQQPIVRFFASMGLRTDRLAAKPVLTAWETQRRRPYQPGP